MAAEATLQAHGQAMGALLRKQRDKGRDEGKTIRAKVRGRNSEVWRGVRNVVRGKA